MESLIDKQVDRWMDRVNRLKERELTTDCTDRMFYRQTDRLVDG